MVFLSVGNMSCFAIVIGNRWHIPATPDHDSLACSQTMALVLSGSLRRAILVDSFYSMCHLIILQIHSVSKHYHKKLNGRMLSTTIALGADNVECLNSSFYSYMY